MVRFMKYTLAIFSSAAVFWASLAMTLGDLIFVGVGVVMLFFVVIVVKSGREW